MTLKADINTISHLLDMADVLQKEANKNNITNVFDDGGYRELLLTKIFGLTKMPGRHGDDGIDPVSGKQYELKTVNLIDTSGDLRIKPGVTTCHHVNYEIIKRYRSVAGFIIGIFYINDPVRIYEVSAENMEPYFKKWENRLNTEEHLEHINNPKFSFNDVLNFGVLHYKDSKYDEYFETLSQYPRISSDKKDELHSHLNALREQELQIALSKAEKGKIKKL